MRNIVLPMLGDSSRFFKEGFAKPKYELRIRDKSLFELALLSFDHYFDDPDSQFIFLVRKDFEGKRFVEYCLKRINLRQFRIIEREGSTSGQAESVYIGAKQLDRDDTLLIFNVDSMRCDFRYPERRTYTDGFLEVFEGPGDHWSFATCTSDKILTGTAEKKRISKYCSNGLYYFQSIELFIEGYTRHVSALEGEVERYVAPIYNSLIEMGYVFTVVPIDKSSMVFCGTPEEYHLLLDQRVQG